MTLLRSRASSRGPPRRRPHRPWRRRRPCRPRPSPRQTARPSPSPPPCPRTRTRTLTHIPSRTPNGKRPRGPPAWATKSAASPGTVPAASRWTILKIISSPWPYVPYRVAQSTAVAVVGDTGGRAGAGGGGVAVAHAVHPPARHTASRRGTRKKTTHPSPCPCPPPPIPPCRPWVKTSCVRPADPLPVLPAEPHCVLCRCRR